LGQGTSLAGGAAVIAADGVSAGVAVASAVGEEGEPAEGSERYNSFQYCNHVADSTSAQLRSLTQSVVVR
jgi:hypothetical protein